MGVTINDEVKMQTGDGWVSLRVLPYVSSAKLARIQRAIPDFELQTLPAQQPMFERVGNFNRAEAESYGVRAAHKVIDVLHSPDGSLLAGIWTFVMRALGLSSARDNQV